MFWRLTTCTIVLFLVCSCGIAIAQNGKYDLRLIQESVDCGTRKITFVAQIKASNLDSAFILGTSNLPFTVSPGTLTNPVLSSIDNYSGGRYGLLTLVAQGSVLTLNVLYNGSAPFDDTVNVTTSWSDIAHLTFDIPVGTDGCYTATWNGPGAFPSARVSQVVIEGPVATEVPAISGTLGDAAGCAFAASLPTATITGDTVVNSGQQATLKVSFDGSPPTSISVAGVVYNNLSVSPLNINVFPDQTTTYTIDSVSNACGRGTVSGSATVTIAAVPPADTIATLDVAADTVCLGSDIQVAFTTNAFFNSANAFKVQLSDANGSNFTDISSTGTATPGPLNATIPANLPGGAGYRVRVVSTGPGITGTASAPFVIADAPTATLSGNATITSGDSANLTVNFTGRGPWKIQLSDGSEFTTSVNPFTIPVFPTQTTTYSLTALEDACIEGLGSGTATVTVLPDGEPCTTLCVPVTVAIIKK
ncbi:hypothetical protein GCM10007390_33350 [Persicitalea jodogahamensis]|uniref:Immunoglobulin domain-containing protein n=2 Tax=Persicitalea jodogahamensis TaxID=402147 RepID=A0A8J3D5C5_9BACT|nr:hypothetical protein GCM10007390_33350 [Persicitalea jodogahamensis]